MDGWSGAPVCLASSTSEDDLIVVTDKGMVIRTHLDQVLTIGRDTQGVCIIKLNEGQKAASIAIVPRSEDNVEIDDEYREDFEFDDDYEFLDKTVEFDEAFKEDLQVVHPIPDETSGYFSEEIRKFLIDKFPDESLNKSGLIVRATLDSRFQRCAYDALRKGIEKIDRHYGWTGATATIKIEQSQKEIIKQ